MSTLSATFEGPYQAVFRKLLKRGAILAKLELLGASSKQNLDFIESSFGSANAAATSVPVFFFPATAIQVKEKLRHEKKKVRNEQKLLDLSKEILTAVKKDEKSCEPKYKPTIQQWCKNRPIKNTVKSIWRFLESIKDMVAATAASTTNSTTAN